MKCPGCRIERLDFDSLAVGFTITTCVFEQPAREIRCGTCGRTIGAVRPDFVVEDGAARGTP